MITAIRCHDQSMLALLDGWLGLDWLLLRNRLWLRKRLNLHHWRLRLYSNDLLRRFINTYNLWFCRSLCFWLLCRLRHSQGLCILYIPWFFVLLDNFQRHCIVGWFIAHFRLHLLLRLCKFKLLGNLFILWRINLFCCLLSWSNLCNRLFDGIQHRFDDWLNWYLISD